MINRIAGVPLERKPSAGVSQSPKKLPFDLQDLSKVAASAENLITQNPAAAIAAAFCLGVALAWWIKRSK